MINLKPAKFSDCRFWWKIRNEKIVREASFNTKSIPYSTHTKWFTQKLKDKNSKLFIVLLKNKKVGQLRLEKNGKEVEISLALVSSARGKGLGTSAIALGVKKAISEFDAKKILAYTKPENLASLRAFEKAGFKNRGSTTHKNTRAVKLEFSGQLS